MSTHSALPKFSLRPMTADDLTQVLSIEKQCYPEPWKTDQFLGEMKKKFARSLVITDDDTDEVVVGYIIYWLQAEGVSLLNVAVAPSWRGFGFGMQLMQAMIKEAVLEDISRIILEVRESNAGAIAMYEKIGFKKTHERPGFYKNGETALVMEIKTSDASSIVQ